VKSVARFWIAISLSSVTNAESISVSISLEKKRLAQSPIPIILGIIIVEHA